MPNIDTATDIDPATRHDGGGWLLSRRGFLATAAAASAASALTAGAQPLGSGAAAQGSLKVISAGSTLYGMRPAAETFARGADAGRADSVHLRPAQRPRGMGCEASE